jgi:carbonic anhydrase/acetyltransferase-like protein (isoleucine patch superfamily)
VSADPQRGLLLAFRGKMPRVAEDAYVAPGAVVIGDVELGPRSSVWFNVTVRGDDHWIRIGADSNIQDNTVIHVNVNDGPTEIGERVTVGHGAVLHGCHLMDDCMVGMGAVVLDGATVEPWGVVAAGAVVSPGRVVRTGELWAGVPARRVREVRPEERSFIEVNASHYHHRLALEYLGRR